MNKMKLCRIQNGLSQLELAAASGVSRWSIQLFESAVSIPTEDELKKLSAALGVEKDHLISIKMENRKNGK